MAYSLDDAWDNCTPVARAGNACFGFYVRCGIWVARNLTDGFVPGEIATAYGSPEQARKLVDVGLWEAAEGGYVARDYLTLNPTAERVRVRRKADAERQAKVRAGRRGPRRKPVTADHPRDSAVSHGVTHAVSPRAPAAPPNGGAGAHTPARTREAADDTTPEHTSAAENLHWRSLPAFGVPPDADLAERARRGAALARTAAINGRQPTPEESPA